MNEVDIMRPVRKCILKQYVGNGITEDREELEHEAKFHGWTQSTRCNVGDGSMLHVVMLAVIELEDGDVMYAEPHEISFSS